MVYFTFSSRLTCKLGGPVQLITYLMIRAVDLDGIIAYHHHQCEFVLVNIQLNYIHLYN